MNKTFTIRNLKYNIYQLLLVGFMMLLATQTLGLVCYNLLPNVKPILLDNAGADAKQISLILATLPNAIAFVLCPLISTISDKTRTRIGRRMPYLIFTAPVLALLLVMIAFYHEITAFITKIIPVFGNINAELWVLAVLMLVFQIVFLFPGSVVYYLVADVIPKEFIGRYTAVATVCSSAITAGFNFFLLKASVENTKYMFVLMGVLYLTVYVLLLCTVKEGEYPELNDNIDKSKSSFQRGYEYFLLFFKECFGHKIYVLLFLSTGLNQASNICRGMYNVLFATKDIGVSVELYGKIMGIGSIIAMIAVFLGLGVWSFAIVTTRMECPLKFVRAADDLSTEGKLEIWEVDADTVSISSALLGGKPMVQCVETVAPSKKSDAASVQINVVLTPEASQLWYQFTSAAQGHHAALYMDGVQIQDMYIQCGINNGCCFIVKEWSSKEELKEFCRKLSRQ